MSFNPFDNPEFRAEFEEVLDRKLSPIAGLVAQHEQILQRTKGAAAVGRWVWGAIIALAGAAEWFFHRR